jgi:sialic acid synthase SpsE
MKYITPVTKILKYAAKHHKNVTVSSGGSTSGSTLGSTKTCDENVSLKAVKVYPEN